jgi:hypothetical protein
MKMNTVMIIIFSKGAQPNTGQPGQSWVGVQHGTVPYLDLIAEDTAAKMKERVDFSPRE